MLPIRTILQPTDFSAPAEDAFELACSLARDYGARVIVLHVKPPDMMLGDPYQPPPPDPAVIRKALMDRLYHQQPPRGCSIVVEYRLEGGDPATAIVDVAKETKSDLLVMGTHGRTGVSRVLMGSVAEMVLRKAPCPVLTVKAPILEDRTTWAKEVAAHSR